MDSWDHNAGRSPRISAGDDGDERAVRRAGQRTAQDIQDWLVAQLAERLGIPPQEIDVREPFADYGLSSREAIVLSGDLKDLLGRSLSPTLVWEYPSIAALAQHLAGTTQEAVAASISVAGRPVEREPIAIIGVGCRFPGADTPTAFWQLLRDGVDAITEIPPERWDPHTFYDPNPAVAGKMNTCWGGFLTQVDQFDPGFFGISPREATHMDPQQRILLEVAWEAIEDAGLAPERLSNTRTGVFIGISLNEYSRLQLDAPELLDAYSGTGNALSIAANRISYLLDLRGPSMAVDTACSSSLVAVHLACNSLWNGESSLALAGGVNVILAPEATIIFSQARMMSSDGRCKTFDATADGYVRGEGCGVVVLKPLSHALRDGDAILALIRGSAINQDGRSNGLTAPNGLAQQAVIREALDNAGVAPAQIGYVEAHGTGTSLGDPIELQMLGAALQAGRREHARCAVGSVKTNIGHLEAAAGIAGLIKAALCLAHGEIPPHLHLHDVNPHIALAQLPLTIPTERQPWPSGAERRFASVSSFGFGGTNAHVVLEEAPRHTVADAPIERPLQLLTLSARSPDALYALAERYAKQLAEYPAQRVADICFSANTGRSHFAHRIAAMAATPAQLLDQLRSFAVAGRAAGVQSGQAQGKDRPKLAFLFTGQGSQYPDMGLQLYQTQPVFRDALDRCAEILRPWLDRPLLSALYPQPGESACLEETIYAQPALFALEYALAEMWKSWGIVPDAVMGHSVGEYVAACVAEAFSLDDGLKLIVARARLMQSLQRKGRMAVVFADEARVAAVLAPVREQISIAAVNGPRNIVISGASEAVEAVCATLEAAKIITQPLKVSHAFHSALMDPMLDDFERLASQVRFSSARIPLLSNVTGQMTPPGSILDAGYWRRHVRETVQFAAEIETLGAQGYDLFLELGPAPVLTAMGKRLLEETNATWLPSMKQAGDDWRVLLDSLSKLYLRGAEVDWAGFDRGYARRKVSLPTYPFERKRYWVETNRRSSAPPRELDRAEARPAPSPIDSAPEGARRESIVAMVRSMAAGLLKANPDEIDIHTSFLEMGADSIVLVEAIQSIQDTFKITLSIRQLFEAVTTISALADYLDREIPPELSLSELISQKPAQKHEFWSRHASKPALAPVGTTPIDPQPSHSRTKHIDFSLYYFGDYPAEFSEDKYHLLLEGAKFADKHNFKAIWIPERHFHSFGGFSPNPSVIAAALARETEDICLRAGSVVLPLHHPIRVAEEWSVVDNLSKGRVGIAFASGWHPDDFVFAPERFGTHREYMSLGIDMVRKLWRGEHIQVSGGAGNAIDVRLFPMPVQRDLPIWLTIVNNPQTYVQAGELGAGILTNLMGQTIDDLRNNIQSYRAALQRNNHDPNAGHVTVLVHTFVGEDLDLVRQQARAPFCRYLKSSVGLFKNMIKSQGLQIDLDRVAEDDLDFMLSTVYDRYVQTSALIGTPASCAAIVDSLKEIGVDEISCFVDFGINGDAVLESLHHVNVLREAYGR